MKTKLLCSILAMLMLLSLVACNPGNPHPPADTDASTTPDTTDTEPADQTTEPEPEPEPEPPLDIEVPAYEDIGLTATLSGLDMRTSLHYNFADYKYSKLKSDNTLVFESPGFTEGA